MSSVYEGLDHLPIELQRNFKLMRNLDSRAQEVMQQIDLLSEGFMRNRKTLPVAEQKQQLAEIQNLFNKAKVCGIALLRNSTF